MALYALPHFERGDAETFLSLVSRRLGKVKRGGIPDKAATVDVYDVLKQNDPFLADQSESAWPGWESDDIVPPPSLHRSTLGAFV